MSLDAPKQRDQAPAIRFVQAFEPRTLGRMHRRAETICHAVAFLRDLDQDPAAIQLVLRAADEPSTGQAVDQPGDSRPLHQETAASCSGDISTAGEKERGAAAREQERMIRT